MEKYSVSKGRAEVYRIVLSEVSGWADITIEEHYNGGSFKAVSDFGNFCCVWTNIGTCSFKYFLANISFDYFMAKTYGPDYIELDASGTVNEIKYEILSLRRERLIDRREARSLYDRVNTSLSIPFDDSDEYLDILKSLGITEQLFAKHFQSRDLPIVNRYNSDCLMFWEYIWPCFCDAIQREFERNKIKSF